MRLEITDSERITRFKASGYGGSVSDALATFGVRNTVLSQEFKPIRHGMQLVGRALPVKLHSQVQPERSVDEWNEYRRQRGVTGEDPQQIMMQTIADSEDGTILCFDCGGDTQVAHFGEMSVRLAAAQGCSGALIAGNCRDVRCILRGPEFPLFSLGTTPNALGGWKILEVGEPIFLPGHVTHSVKVDSRSFIFGDEDGVQVIPGDYIDDVLVKVEDTYAEENKLRDRLESGIDVSEAYRTYGVL